MYFGTFIRHDWVYRQSDDMAQYTEKQSLYIEVHDSDPLLVHTVGILNTAVSISDCYQ